MEAKFLVTWPRTHVATKFNNVERRRRFYILQHENLFCAEAICTRNIRPQSECKHLLNDKLQENVALNTKEL